MRTIGFSHGVLYRVADVYSEQIIDLYRGCSDAALETCVSKADDADKLQRIIPYVRDFSYKSVHLPSDIRYVKDEKTIRLLDKIVNYYKEVGASLALVHPDVVDDWEVFDRYKINWAIENMDNRKGRFKTAGELEEFLGKNPNWRLVLDLNHCFTNDRSMALAESILHNLKDKIAEVHLSGYINLHDPLFASKQDFIIDYCRKLDTPIIIESTFDSIDDVKKEYNYIIEKLK